MKNILKQSFLLFISMSVICGIFYTFTVHIIGQSVFSFKANGSILEANNKDYSLLMGQSFKDDKHMWGRMVNIDVITYKDKDGNSLAYGSPSNISPASKEYEELIKQRVKLIKESNYEMKDTPVPVDLISGSASGLDPHISLAAANYQVKRLARTNNISEKEVLDMIEKCKESKIFGVVGEDTVNVVKMNLMIDGIIASS